MSKRKDIEDLFRDGASQMRQQPSSHAWDRLESRLDKRRATGGSTLYRRLAMAAALLLLVTMVALLPMYLGPKSGEQMAFNQNGSFGMEEINSEGGMRPLPISEVYSDVNLREGDSQKRITVAVRNAGPLNQPPNYDRAETPTMLADEVTSPDDIPETIVQNEPAFEEEDDAEIAAETSPPAEYDAVSETPQPVEPAYGPPTYQEPSVAMEENAGMEPVAKEKLEKRADVQIQEMNAASNAIQFESESLDPSVQQFQWLIGQWQSEEGIGRSVEQWEIQNKFTISGKGLLVLNGKETFTEEMQIRKIGEQLYFITAIDETGKERYFRLKSYTDGIAIFEDEENADFPQQVIIEQEGPNTYNAIFTEEEHKDMTPTQQNYLRYRNAVEPDRATRNMSRMGN